MTAVEVTPDGVGLRMVKLEKTGGVDTKLLLSTEVKTGIEEKRIVVSGVNVTSVLVMSTTEDLGDKDGVNMLTERVNSSEDIGISMVRDLEVETTNDVSGKLTLGEGERVGTRTVEEAVLKLKLVVNGKIGEDSIVKVGVRIIILVMVIGGTNVSVGKTRTVVDSKVTKEENGGDTTSVENETEVSSAEDIGKSGLSEALGVGSIIGVVENMNMSVVVVGGAMDDMDTGKELVGTSMLERMVNEGVIDMVIIIIVLSIKEGEKDSDIIGREVEGVKATAVCRTAFVPIVLPREGCGLAVKRILDASELGITLLGGATGEEPKLDGLVVPVSKLEEGERDKEVA